MKLGEFKDEYFAQLVKCRVIEIFILPLTEPEHEQKEGVLASVLVTMKCSVLSRRIPLDIREAYGLVDELIRHSFRLVATNQRVDSSIGDVNKIGTWMFLVRSDV